MTEERKTKLLDAALDYLSELSQGEELYRTLHNCMGFTNEELVEYGMEGLQEHFQYEWEDGTLQKQYAELLDSILPQHNVYTTAAWIRFAEELAERAETSFEYEASSLIAVFQNIAVRVSPRAVDTVYRVIHEPDNALLTNEIPAAAEEAERGATAKELSKLVAGGRFEDGPAPMLNM